MRHNQRGEMWFGALVVALFAAFALLVLIGAKAFADTVGGGYIGGGDIGVGIDDGQGGEPGGPGGGPGGIVDGGGGTDGGGGNTTYNPIQWRYNDLGATCIRYSADHNNAGVVLRGAPIPPVPEGEPVPVYGWYYNYQLVNVDTGEVITRETPDCAYPDESAPAPPPAPPSSAEVRSRAPLPEPTWGVDPKGMTGMPTWLWDANGSDSRDVAVNVRGYAANVHAVPTSWRWAMAASGEPGPASKANPTPLVTANHPGDAGHPATTYTYETPGTYTLTLTVVWTGTYTFTPAGGVPITQPLGSVVRTSTRSYQVEEVRPVIVTGTVT